MLLKSVNLQLKSIIKHQPCRAVSSKVLIETAELDTLIKEQPDKVSVLNATYTIGNIVPRDEHIKGRIPASIFYDFTAFSDN